MLPLWPHRHDHFQFRHLSTCCIRRSRRCLSYDTLHHGNCTWFRRPYQPSDHFCNHGHRLDWLSRGILYLVGQLISAALTGGVLRGAFGAQRAIIWKGGGCFRDAGTVVVGQTLLVETMSSFTLLTLALGVALDPRQQKLFGPLLGPLAVGCSLGLVSFARAGLVEGYTGASMNPGRCFAFAITRHDFTGTWAERV